MDIGCHRSRRVLRGRDVALVGFAIGAVCAVFFYGIVATDKFLAAQQGRGWFSIAALVAVLVLEPVAVFITVHFLLIRRRGLSWRDLGVRPTTLKWVTVAAAAAPVSLGLSAAINNAINPIIDPAAQMNQYAALLAPHGTTLLGAAGFIVVIGLLVPVAEEVLFRGMIYGWLRQRLGIVISIVASAAIFSVAHMNVQAALQVFMIGAVLAYLYERSGSIVPPMVTHATINVSSLVVVFLYAGSATTALAP